jgi:hypothetical protein
LTKARLGDLSQLALLGDQVRRTVRVGAGDGGRTVYNYWMTYYDAACVHAGLAQLARQDQESPSAERQRLAPQEYEHALELLGKSRATGEFSGMIRLDEIRRERLLDPLRSDPRFRLLMMDLAMPADPFARAH